MLFNKIIKVYNIIIITIIGGLGFLIYKYFKNLPDSFLYKAVSGAGKNVAKTMSAISFFLYDDQIGYLSGEGYTNNIKTERAKEFAEDVQNSKPLTTRLKPKIAVLYPPLQNVVNEFIKQENIKKGLYNLNFELALFEIERTKQQALINEQKGTGIANSMHVKQADGYVYAFDFVPKIKGGWSWFEGVNLENTDAFLYRMIDLFKSINSRLPKNRVELITFAYSKSFRNYNDHSTIATNIFLNFYLDIRRVADRLGYQGDLLVRPKTDYVHTELNYKNKYKFTHNNNINNDNNIKKGEGGRLAGGI